MDILLIEGGTELLDRVAPIWTQLRRHHCELAPQWAQTLIATSFEDRRAKLLTKASQGLLVLLAECSGEDVGYCISSIDRMIGEIDSIFVSAAYRWNGIGRAMMSRTLAWFDEHGVNSIAVEIIHGNEAAAEFYALRGFRPRALRLLRTQVG